MVRLANYHFSTSGLLGVLEYPVFKRYSRPRAGCLIRMRFGFSGVKYSKYSINKLLINEAGLLMVCIDCRTEVQGKDLFLGVRLG